MQDVNDFLNGSFAGPVQAPTNGATGPTPGNVSNVQTGNIAAGQAVLVAWLILFALLVVSNVLTLSVQR